MGCVWDRGNRPRPIFAYDRAFDLPAHTRSQAGRPAASCHARRPTPRRTAGNAGTATRAPLHRGRAPHVRAGSGARAGRGQRIPPGGSSARERHVESHPTGKRLAILSLDALGIVYGDIGTSPLYALQPASRRKARLLADASARLRRAVADRLAAHPRRRGQVHLFIMRADNRGEGGILALLALILQKERRADDKRRDGCSSRRVCSARRCSTATASSRRPSRCSAPSKVSRCATPDSPHWSIVRCRRGDSLRLFSRAALRHRPRSARVRPDHGVWFLTIARARLARDRDRAADLWSRSIRGTASEFFSQQAWRLLALGAVVLAVTGAEALYADMGHFGKRPIRLAWFALVLPALLLNYFGQGALMLRDPRRVDNPFYLLAPRRLSMPAGRPRDGRGVIASQALISGAFSLTQQACSSATRRA